MKTVTATVTRDELQALGWALDLAYDDQYDYMKSGYFPRDIIDAAMNLDETKKLKSEQLNTLGNFAERIGLSGEQERWADLAKQFENQQ